MILPLYPSEFKKKQYAWQQDDSLLMAQMPLTPHINPAPDQTESKLTAHHIEKLKVTVSHWVRRQKQEQFQMPVKPKLTDTARQKKEEIKKFLGSQLEAYGKRLYLRDSALAEIKKWRPETIALLPEDPQFDSFLNMCAQNKDAESLRVIATLLDMVGRAHSAKDPSTYAHWQGRQLEKKALDIIVQIKKFEYVNQSLEKRIKEHIEAISAIPELREHYEVALDPRADTYPPLPVFKLGWLPAEKDRIILDEKPKTKKTLAKTTSSAKTETKKDAPIDPQTLLKESTQLFKNEKYEESADKAWQVIKSSNVEKNEYKLARQRIDHLCRKKLSFNALCMQTVLHKDNPEAAISFFMDAQNMRPSTIIKDPKTTSPLTFNALFTRILPVASYQHSAIKEAVDLIAGLVKLKNIHARQALAVYHHRTAASFPELQLLFLKAAVDCLDCDHTKSQLSPLPGFDARQILFDFAQQLYVFARNEQNLQVNNILPLPKYLKSISLTAQAYQNLRMLATYDPEASLWSNQSLETLKSQLLRAKKFIDAEFKLVTNADSVCPILSEDVIRMLMEGANGLPLSINQRKKIISTHTSKNPQDLLAVCLSSKKYEGSPYQRAAHKENLPRSDEYFRMLFALDSGDMETAFALATKVAKEHSDSYARMYSRNILLNTDIVLKSDPKRFKSIATVFEDARDYSKTLFTMPLYCDAIELLAQMAATGFTPAIELLLENHLANEHDNESLETIMHSFAQLKRGNETFSHDLAELPYSLSEDILWHLSRFCDIHKNNDPIWAYLDYLVTILPTMSAQEAAQLVAVNINKMYAIITTTGIQTAKKNNRFLAESSAKRSLATHVDSLSKNVQICSHLEKNQCLESIRALDNFLNPDKLKNSATIQKETNLAENSFVQNYINSPQYEEYKTITQYRTKKQFKEYKELRSTNKLRLENKISDIHFKIHTLMITAAHCYMLAQAESDNSIEISGVKEAQDLIDQAISIHPFFAYLAMTRNHLMNELWPYDFQKAQEFLNKAAQWADAHKSTIDIEQLQHLASAQTLYRYHKRLQLGILT